MKNNLTIVIPARNEEACIIQTLKEIKNNVKISHNIIVVNDCSKDNTEKLVIKYSKENKNVSIVKTVPNKKGFAQALIKGIEQVKDGFVVIVMADLCDDPKTINFMYHKIQKGWDIVCGSRYIKGGGKKGGPIIQSFLSAIVCLTMNFLIGIPTKDVSNSFKMYRKEVFDKITINSNGGVEVSMEIILQAFFQGFKITEIPTKWKGRTAGKSKFSILRQMPKYSRIYSWALISRARKKLPQN